MKRTSWWICVSLASFAIACSGGEESGVDTGGGATGFEGEGAAGLEEDVTVYEEEVEVATPEAEVGRSATAQSCLELAAQARWAEALDPCTRAARDLPDDAEIQQALEQAQAGAEGAARSAVKDALDGM